MKLRTLSQHVLSLVMAGLILGGCGRATPTVAPQTTSAPSLPATSQAAPPTAGRCGNGVCEGPENDRNCPSDCAASPPAATTTPTSAPTRALKTVVIRVGSVNSNDSAVKPLLGVISGPDPAYESSAPDLTERLQDIGVTSIRNNDYYDDRLDMEGIFNCGGATYPSWEGCNPNEDQYYHWDASDAQFNSYVTGGFEPFLRLGGEWNNGPRQHDFKGPQNKTQERNWIVAAQRVVDRYLQWQGRAPVFTYLDIWTEFPSEHFWDRQPFEFFSFWAQAYTELKQAYPSLKVGGPGFVAGETLRVIQGDSKSIPAAFLEYLYKNKIKPDWIGWHIFQNDPLKWWQAAQAYRDLLAGTGQYANVAWAGTDYFANVEMVVDAYGMSAIGEDGRELSPTELDRIYNQKEAASILTAAWIAMQYQDIERAYYYRAGDPKSEPGAASSRENRGGPGLFYGDAVGTYKPSAQAVRLWSQVVEEFPALLTTELPSTTPGVELWALAAQNDKGQQAILIANVAAEDIAWTLEFASAPVNMSDYAKVQIYQVDDTQDRRTASDWHTGAVTIPGGSVQLVILSP